jgi:hypothetical protein
MTSLKTLIAGGWLATALFAVAAPAPSPEKLLPDDTLAFLTVPEAAKLKAFFETSPTTAITREPALKAFRDNMWNTIRTNAVIPLEKALLVKAADYDGLLQGQVTFAVLMGEWTGGNDTEPAFLIVVDARDKADQLKETLAKLKKSWTEAGRTLRSDKIRGVEFMTWATTEKEIAALFPKSDKDEEKDEAGKPAKSEKKIEITIGQSDSLLVIGTQAKSIERVLIRQAGGSLPSVSEVPAYQAPQAKLFRDAQFFGWANPQPALKLALEHAPAGGAISPKMVVDVLGLAGLKSASFAVKADDNGSLVEFLLGQPVAERKGLIALLAGEAKPSEPPGFVPGDVLSATRFRLDLAKFWTGLEKMVGELNPTAKSTLNMVLNSAGKSADPNFDIRKELFGNLGDDIIVYQKAPEEITLESMTKQRSLFLVGSPAPERLANGIKVLIETLAAPGMVKDREFLGRKVYKVSGPGGDGVEFVASSGYLAISPDPAVLEEFLRSGDGKGKPLRELEGLTSAAVKVGGTGNGLFGYQNTKEQNRIGAGVSKLWAAEATDPTETPVGQVFGSKIGAMLDYRLYPPFEQVAKYFGFAVFGGEVGPDGYRLRIYSPTPASARQ